MNLFNGVSKALNWDNGKNKATTDQNIAGSEYFLKVLGAVPDGEPHGVFITPFCQSVLRI